MKVFFFMIDDRTCRYDGLFLAFDDVSGSLSSQERCSNFYAYLESL